mgnify:CR=1 FL=1
MDTSARRELLKGSLTDAAYRATAAAVAVQVAAGAFIPGTQP